MEVSTYTAEVLLPDDQVQNLPGDAWETRQTANDMTGGDWDCLVRSGGGRYLWLRLELTGNGKVTPSLETIVIEFPAPQPASLPAGGFRHGAGQR